MPLGSEHFWMANFLDGDYAHQLLLSKAIVSFKTEHKPDGLRWSTSGPRHNIH